MASNINPYNVDGSFPIAGQDNSSQGFRNNFTNIKNNLAFAESEISDLQAKALVTSALSGQTVNNDMAGTQIRRPQLAAWTQSLLDLGTVNTGAVLDFNQANFQKLTTAGSVALSFINWPSSIGSGALGYGVMRVWIIVTSATHTVTLPSSVSITVNDIAGYDIATHTITFDSPGSYMFDISSIDSGTTYLIQDLSRNRASFRDPAIYYNPDVVNTFLVGFGKAVNTALLYEQGQDTVSALGSYNSVTVGNLSLASPIYQYVDTQPLGGYAVTGARGDASILSILPVENKDILGYFNGVAYTGNTALASNTFGTVSTISFHAMGANVTGGLGGNIAFHTAKDGYAGTVTQAMSINNDQSVEVMGQFKTDSGVIENGTYLINMATSGASFTANSSISTIIIDSVNSANVVYANITLPSSPVNGQKLRIASAPIILNANINTPNSELIKFVPTNKFASGNTAIQLTYMAASSTWYLS